MSDLRDIEPVRVGNHTHICDHCDNDWGCDDETLECLQHELLCDDCYCAVYDPDAEEEGDMYDEGFDPRPTWRR